MYLHLLMPEKDKRFFTINLEQQIVKGDNATDIIKQMKLSLTEMEKFLDDIPPTKNTQKIKRKIWDWF